MKLPKLTVTKDFTKQFNEAIKRFKNDTVLVGIPAEDSSRDQDSKDENSSITNAALLAINNFGSPQNNIPARPVMEIGIRNAQEEIAEQYRKALINVLNKGPQAITLYYERAGIVASIAIKKAINDQDGIAPPSEATLKARESQGFKGTKALIRTGQMRNSITYVIKGKG